MENVFLCCDAFQLSQTSYFIVSSLIRFGDSRNVNKNGEYMGINLLFLDEKNFVIHGSSQLLAQVSYVLN
ncbi:unnamed protein product [Brassica napus]|uniref:(rape) hypothetical protein n=1 Tax=Brassica napus TaxID=3708 RepID=A0A816TUW7_BRANA|nr:unnamed protein product [Brassica napus]CAF2123812.1 unnamed protein product [Brassica napus]